MFETPTREIRGEPLTRPEQANRVILPALRRAHALERHSGFAFFVVIDAVPQSDFMLKDVRIREAAEQDERKQH
jgi:hypothetical protein